MIQGGTPLREEEEPQTTRSNMGIIVSVTAILAHLMNTILIRKDDVFVPILRIENEDHTMAGTTMDTTEVDTDPKQIMQKAIALVSIPMLRLRVQDADALSQSRGSLTLFVRVDIQE